MLEELKKRLETVISNYKGFSFEENLTIKFGITFETFYIDVPFDYERVYLALPDKTLLHSATRAEITKITGNPNQLAALIPESQNFTKATTKLFLVLHGKDASQKTVIPLNLKKWPAESTMRLHLNVNIKPMQENRATLSNNEGTYLILYGHGKVNAFNPQDSHHQGDNAKKAGEAMQKQLMATGVSKDRIFLIETYTEEVFFAAINTKYKTGLIKELYVYSHGTANTINLGGDAKMSPEYLNGWDKYITINRGANRIDALNKNLTKSEKQTLIALFNKHQWIISDALVKEMNKIQWDKSEELQESDKKGFNEKRRDFLYAALTAFSVELQDSKWIDADESSTNDNTLFEENEILQINKGNFANNAKIVIRACNVGNEEKAKENGMPNSFAQLLSNHIGGDNTVQAFDDGSQYIKEGKELSHQMTTKPGNKDAKDNLVTFKPKE